MNAKEIKTIVSDWRVAVLIILILGSLIAIYPHFDENGHLASNLQYGLDLQQGAWIQLELRAEVVGFTTDRPLNDFVGNLSQSLDADMELIDANHIEIRKYFTREELEAKFSEQGGTLTSYQEGVSKDSAAHIKTILENKINSMGTKDAKVNTLAGLNNVVRYVRIELAGVNMNEAQQIVGKQGKFEIRVQTTGNQSEHVVFGDKISSVQVPEKDLQSGSWGVSFTLDSAGAAEFQDAAIKYGATDDPDSHELMMILDNVTVYSAPLNDRLASSLKTEQVRQMIASTGTGTAGANAATNLEIHLRAGALPVDVSIAGSGSTSAPLGERYKAMVLLAGVLALLMVACVIYYRYREPGIVLPMVLINASEVLILLGFIAAIKFQLDLPTIAGLIAVLGTGIDQLVIITDEILHEGKVPSPNLYLKRLARALGIIIAAAATVIIAMVPLVLMDLSTLKGFAIITILGVLVGVIITRPAYGKIIMAILSK
ncbi:MAG: preprotein translocase subunit SecD [Methanoregula sp.]|uniref:preprotein translocase subunit SecD n=1 Tax=Methanoregula sp. TaxID=2052170 RepID=UPI0025F8D7F7|nr:preprotein translocase subunit SecD [Methanoregula sp.]MCK9630320.1 preprotein translocase subunit SecD [Methanoregula sp.]